MDIVICTFMHMGKAPILPVGLISKAYVTMQDLETTA